MLVWHIVYRKSKRYDAKIFDSKKRAKKWASNTGAKIVSFHKKDDAIAQLEAEGLKYCIVSRQLNKLVKRAAGKTNATPKKAGFPHEFFKKYKTYKEYLESPEWWERRCKRVALDNHRCAKCGSTVNLNVHHLTYKHAGNEPMKDLITLCKSCHAAVHGKAPVNPSAKA